MKTPKENPPAKEKFLGTAQRLMLSKGYTATTIDEICLEAGLTKGSFFHYFKSKEDLGKAVLDRFVANTFRAEQEAGLFVEPDPLKKIYGYLDYIISVNKGPGHQTGCLIGNFAQVLSESHPEIRALCDRHFSWWAGLMESVMNEAAAVYAPQKKIDAQGLAEHVIAVIEGSLILARAKGDPGPIMERNINNLKGYLRTVFEC